MKANTLEELIEYLSKRFDVSYAKLARIVVKTAKWQKEQDLKEMAQSNSPLSVAYANRCFENGKQAMKEQMLKEAVDGKVVNLADTYDDLTISVEGKELNEALQPLGVKDGDRVKILIIKEDSK